MKINKLVQIPEKPEIYEKGNTVMWTDEYISAQLLKVHLDCKTDLASRKEDTIISTVNWILEKAPYSKMNILDLGCGPGLYTERLAEKGHRVTGMDFSKNSIAHAAESARNKNLDICYLCRDYLSLDLKNSFDLVIMIYTDFGVLDPGERDTLLNRVSEALKPGGIFLFDVMNDCFFEKAVESKNWESADKGFWKNSPYLALSEDIIYREEKVILSQHIIGDESDDPAVYRFWTHSFSPDDLEAILGKHDFKNITFHENVIPGCESYSPEDVTFCIAVKPC